MPLKKKKPRKLLLERIINIRNSWNHLTMQIICIKKSYSKLQLFIKDYYY